MLSYTYKSHNKFELTDKPKPELLDPRDAIVRVTMSSICSSDLHTRAALFVGDVLATGFWATRISEITEDDTVLIIGAGPTGICTLLCTILSTHKPLSFLLGRGLCVVINKCILERHNS